MSFESVIIDTSQLFDVFIIGPMKLAGAFGVAGFIIFHLFKSNAGAGSVGTFSFMLDLMKAFIYGCVAYHIFFYDFEVHQLVSRLPEKMYFTTFLLGCFSMFECVSNLLSAARSYFDTFAKMR